MGSDQVAAAAAPEPAPEKPSPVMEPKAQVLAQGQWRFTETGAMVGVYEFKLRDGATSEVLLKYGQQSLVAAQAYVVVLSAMDALSGARGDFEELLERIRETVRARDRATETLEGLTDVFCGFYEPAGLREAFQDADGLTRFARETVQRFGG